MDCFRSSKLIFSEENYTCRIYDPIIISRNSIFLSAFVLNLSRGLTCLSTESHEDVWCVDPRGVLTLSTTKETYETLGLTGGKVVVGYGKKHPSEERHGNRDFSTNRLTFSDAV